MATPKFTLVHSVVNPVTGRLKPDGRSGHCFVGDDEGSLYVYGGYNPKAGPYFDEYHLEDHRQVMTELWHYNLHTNIWTLLSDRSVRNIHGTGASASMVLLGNKLLIFGGTVIPWGKVMGNTVTVCDMDISIWYKLPDNTENEHDIPPKGYGQSLVYDQGSLYVFTGATGYDTDPVSQLQCFDLKSKTWRLLPDNGDIPLGRYKQEMFIHKNSLCILGGGHEDESASLDHIYAYDLETLEWRRCPCMPDTTFKHVYPQSRASFACVRYQESVYILGGRFYVSDIATYPLDDVWRLDLGTLQWTRQAILLPDRYMFNTAVCTRAGYVYMYGGIRSGSEAERSGDLYRWRMFCGDLAELAWEALMAAIPRPELVTNTDLESIGVPQRFRHRIRHRQHFPSMSE